MCSKVEFDEAERGLTKRFAGGNWRREVDVFLWAFLNTGSHRLGPVSTQLRPKGCISAWVVGVVRSAGEDQRPVVAGLA